MTPRHRHLRSQFAWKAAPTLAWQQHAHIGSLGRASPGLRPPAPSLYPAPERPSCELVPMRIRAFVADCWRQVPSVSPHQSRCLCLCPSSSSLGAPDPHRIDACGGRNANRGAVIGPYARSTTGSVKCRQPELRVSEDAEIVWTGSYMRMLQVYVQSRARKNASYANTLSFPNPQAVQMLMSSLCADHWPPPSSSRASPSCPSYPDHPLLSSPIHLA